MHIEVERIKSQVIDSGFQRHQFPGELPVLKQLGSQRGAHDILQLEYERERLRWGKILYRADPDHAVKKRRNRIRKHAAQESIKQGLNAFCIVISNRVGELGILFPERTARAFRIGLDEGLEPLFNDRGLLSEEYS
jgi:hypothetical protein